MMDEAKQAALTEELTQALDALAMEGGCGLNRQCALMELNEMQDEKSLEPRHAQFLKFCEHVVVGYAGMTDQQITDAAETPAVMKYFITALANYERRIGLSPSPKGGTVRRRKLLAEAFGIEGEHGGERQGQSTVEWQMRALNSYLGALHAPEGNTKEARKAAYKYLFGPACEHDRRQVLRNWKRLLRVLADHGYMR